MLRNFLFSFIFVCIAFFVSEEASAQSCWFYCPSQQTIIGYQPYPYYTPRLTYDLNYGYAPIYAGQGYGGGYGGGPYGGSPYGNGYGPNYGTGYGNNGGYNPNWYNQNFPFSYPRGLVNLRPRSGGSSSRDRGYTSVSTPSRRDPPKPEPSIVPPPREPEIPVIAPPVVAEPLPVRLPPVVVRPPEDTLEEVTDCKDIKTSTGRTSLAGDANGKRCDEKAERMKKNKDRVVIEHYTRAESGVCTIKYMNKKDYDMCNNPASVPDRSGDCPPGQEQNCKPAQTTGLGPDAELAKPVPLSTGTCPAGEAIDPNPSDKMGTKKCIPCSGRGYTVTGSGACGCADGYGESITKSGLICVPPHAEGDVPCLHGNCDEPKLPVTDPNKCQYKVGDKVLEFDCACKDNNKIYPLAAFSHPTSAKPYDSKFEQELNADATIAICMHQNMSTGLGSNGHLGCSGPEDAGKRSGSGYCFTPEYYTDTYKAFQEAAACFGLNQEEKNQMFAKIAVESKFHADAVNPGDPSVGIGQIHYASGKTGNELKNSNKYDSYLKTDACKSKFQSLRGELGRFSTINSSSNHLCSATQSPEQGMFLAMAVFKNKKDAVNALLDRTCKGLTKKAKDAFESVDETLKARLTSLAYNMGEGNVEGVVCSYLQAKETTNSSYKSKRWWTLKFDRTNILSGGADIDADTSTKPTKGFWGLVQTYYNDVVNGKWKRECIKGGKSKEECSQLNYVYAISNRSKATSKSTGVECPKP